MEDKIILCGVWEVISTTPTYVVKNIYNQEEMTLTKNQYYRVLNKQIEISTIRSRKLGHKTDGIVIMNRKREEMNIKSMAYLSFAESVKKERERKLLTQKQLADKSGVSLATIQAIEQGFMKDYRTLTIYKLENALELNEGFFLRKIKLDNKRKH